MAGRHGVFYLATCKLARGLSILSIYSLLSDLPRPTRRTYVPAIAKFTCKIQRLIFMRCRKRSRVLAIYIVPTYYTLSILEKSSPLRA